MNIPNVEFLLYFYNNIDIFVIILVRIIAFITMCPVFTTANIPPTTKIAFSFFLAYIIFISGKVTTITYEPNIIGFVSLVLQEFIVGFTMAFVMYIFFTTILFAGQLIDFQIGFSMISIFDPMTQLQVPITGNLIYFAINSFFILSGGLHYFIAGIFFTYDAIQPGTAFILNNPKIMGNFLEIMSFYFIFGVQVAMPVIATILIVDVVLGVLVKAVPQMNVFVVGMPIKLLIGLAILYTTIPLINTLYQVMYEKSVEAFVNMGRSIIK